MIPPTTDPLHYAGFWSRLGALLLDSLILLPLSALMFWGTQRFRLFNLYGFVPATLFGLYYSVYLVQRYGGTPDKLIAGLRIRKVSGEPIGYREAWLRYLPEFALGLLMSIAMLLAVFHMSDSEYHALSFMERTQRMVALAPSWFRPVEIAQHAWVWGELVVLLTNQKRRALHDFIAGTVVDQTRPSIPLQATAPAPVG